MSDLTRDSIIIHEFDRHGFDAIVKKCGSKWAVGFEDRGYPGLFNTRKQAVEWATRWIAILRESPI